MLARRSICTLASSSAPSPHAIAGYEGRKVGWRRPWEENDGRDHVGCMSFRRVKERLMRKRTVAEIDVACGRIGADSPRASRAVQRQVSQKLKDDE
ncbi:hypothetical protein K458DRAFT_100545 [Lentithecium fluviatile CBS 122367]|uniref:Uncharacterized protein n=1 Tax=Lentithecium fluviatile CBS 122367 TaxID=1168545 RepID=A0A6G1JJ94_9PLEO|nr:hypothetical protein K458DRAFT_100545 [Lentithecium fluviatile CBS 122367]